MERRLAAILAADVVGYTRLMGADEAGTLQRLIELRQSVVEPLIIAHHGRIVKLMGDGLLAEFASVVDTVACALAWQDGVAEHQAEVDADSKLQFRIGINLGDVIVEDGDIHGDGVNIAARLEGLAEPGGICLSGDAFRQAKGKIEAAFEDMGEQILKHVSEPVSVYRINNGQPVGATPSSALGPLTSPDKPRIAVLPFDNMSGDPEQQYFSDGLTEDIITALSKYHWLDVVARNTTFTFKGIPTDIRTLAAELGAHYIVEGSVRRAGQRIRVTAQLIDTASGNHVWAEKYDRKLADIFDVQDEITETIVGRIEPEIGSAIRQKVQRAPPRNLHAWDSYHLGIANFYKFTAQGNLEAQRLLQRSRELDPDFAEAHAWWAYATILGMVYWDTEPDAGLMNEALAAARQAVALESQNAMLHMLMGRIQLARKEYRSALAENETAIRLNPTLAPAFCGLGDSLCYEGRYDEAIAQFEKAVAMSPNHPQLWAFLSYGALAYLLKQSFEKALEWAERARDIPNCQYWATAHAAVALAQMERQNEAHRMVAQLLTEKPDFTRQFAEKKLFYLKRADQLQLYLEGLDKAGVPLK